MCAQTVAKDDRSAPLMVPPIKSRMPWHVVAVSPLPDYRLDVQFIDGTQGLVNMRDLVLSPEAGVFAALADPARFAAVFVEYGAVTWPGEIDLAPDAMHQAIRETGQWVLT